MRWVCVVIQTIFKNYLLLMFMLMYVRMYEKLDPKLAPVSAASHTCLITAAGEIEKENILMYVFLR